MVYLEKVDTGRHACRNRREEELNDEYQAEQITSWKNIFKLPLKGIMSSASQINPDVTNTNILLFQFHSSISLLQKQDKFRGL